MIILCKNKRVAVAQLELHCNVHTGISILEHCMSPILDRRYISHVLQVATIKGL